MSRISPNELKQIRVEFLQKRAELYQTHKETIIDFILQVFKDSATSGASIVTIKDLSIVAKLHLSLRGVNFDIISENIADLLEEIKKLGFVVSKEAQGFVMDEQGQEVVAPEKAATEKKKGK